MDWIIATVLAAVSYVIIAIISKEVMENVSPLFFTAVSASVSTFFYLPVFIYHFSTSSLPAIYNISGFIIFSILTNVLGWFAYNQALKNDPVSVVMPLNRLQPVFVALLGVVILNEAINFRISLGILMATFGGYLVLLKNPNHLITPFKDILSDKGEQLAILSAIAFGFAAISDRIVTTNIPPELHAFFILFGLTAILNTYLYKRNGFQHIKQTKKELKQQTKPYLTVGILQSISLLAILTALSLQEASKVIPLLQIQVPLTVIAGGTLLNEEHITIKLIGSTILIIGVTLVAI